MNELESLSEQKIEMLWRVRSGNITKAPLRCRVMEGGLIKPPGSIYTLGRPRIEKWESYHPTIEEARAHILAAADKEVEEAKRELKNAIRRQGKAYAKFAARSQSVGATLKEGM